MAAGHQSGVSRRMGALEKMFGPIFRTGIEEFRQRCLYVERRPKGPQQTPQTVSVPEAFSVICAAVETLKAHFDIPGEMEGRIVALQECAQELNMGYSL